MEPQEGTTKPEEKKFVQHKMIIPHEYKSLELPLSENFDELKFNLVCELVVEPCIQDKESLKVWGMPEDLERLRLEGYGIHPQRPPSLGYFFIRNATKTDYSTIKIIAYLKNNKTISFAATKNIGPSRVTIGETIPQDITINVLEKCELYGQLKTEKFINLVLARKALITNMAIFSKTVQIKAENTSEIKQSHISANLILTTSEHVKIDELNLEAGTIESTIGNHSIINIKGQTVFHEFSLGDFVTYLCDELKCERDTKANSSGIGCLTGFSSTNVLLSLRNRSSINVTRASRTFAETTSLDTSLDQVKEEN